MAIITKRFHRKALVELVVGNPKIQSIHNSCQLIIPKIFIPIMNALFATFEFFIKNLRRKNARIED